MQPKYCGLEKIQQQQQQLPKNIQLDATKAQILHLDGADMVACLTAAAAVSEEAAGCHPFTGILTLERAEAMTRRSD